MRNALHVESVLTIPIYAAHQPFGALVLARSGAPFTQGDVDLLDALAASAGATLAARHEADLGLKDMLARRARQILADVLGPRLLGPKLAALALVTGVALAALLKDTHRITAPAQINGEARRLLSAPFDGYLQAQFRARWRCRAER